LKAFDLKTGNGKRSVLLPGSHAFCNDITVDAKGAAYVTDSANPTILKLSVGAAKFEVFAQDSAFSAPQSGGAGLDGIAFGSDGNPIAQRAAPIPPTAQWRCSLAHLPARVLDPIPKSVRIDQSLGCWT